MIERVKAAGKMKGWCLSTLYSCDYMAIRGSATGLKHGTDAAFSKIFKHLVTGFFWKKCNHK